MYRALRVLGQFGDHLISRSYRAFSNDVTAAMLVFRNKGMVAMMVYKTNPPGMELYFMQILSFVSVI